MPVPIDLSKLSDVVKNDAYNKLVAKVDNINARGFVLKTKYDTNKLELENKIPDTSGLVKKTNYEAEITEIKGKIPDVYKITEIQNKHNNHHDKYITTQEYFSC